MSPTRATDGAAARASPSGGRHDAVDAVCTAVGVGDRAPGRRTTRGRVRASTRRRRVGAVGERSATTGPPPAPTAGASARTSAITRSARCRGGRPVAASQPSELASPRRRERATADAGSGRDAVIGVDHARPSHLDDRRSARCRSTRRAPSTPADGRCARRRPAVVAANPRARRNASNAVTARRGAAARRGSARTGQPVPRQRRHLVGGTPLRPPARITPVRRRAGRAGSRRQPKVATPRSPPPARFGAAAARPAAPSSGSRNGRLRCTGPVPPAATLRAGERTPVERRGGVGDARIVEPAHGAAVQIGLVDRLGRADIRGAPAAGRQ